ncbi:MAG: dihydroorotase [Candidatus Aminicenantes bacterium]|nr:dihydroorotase [Candidatus Aminicenantes bacterium]
MKLLIKNGRVIDPSSGTDDTLNILIEQGKIRALGAKLEIADASTIDASRLVVAPGFIDLHSHVREPGQEDKEDIATASQAAAKGGFTSICAMANTNPVNDHRVVTKYIISEAQKRAIVSILPVAAVTKGLAGNQLTDLADLMAAGAVAFSDDGRGIQSGRIMREALEIARGLNALIIDHCEDESLSGQGLVNEGQISARMGLRGIPSSAEDVMVSRDIILAAEIGSRVHIAHLSTRGAVELVRWAKEKKSPVTAEVTPHHLVLTDTALKSGHADLKVNPPLRDARDAEALRKAVADGVIDVFATDHAPHTPEQKALGIEQAPFGIAGLETAVSVLLDRLVRKQIISLTRFIEMFSTRPAQILGLTEKGRISPGADADLTILNLHKEVVVDVGRFASKSRNNPFHGWKLKGAPQMTIVGGKVVYPFSHSSKP